MTSLRAFVGSPRHEGSDDLNAMVGHRLRALRLQRGLSRRALGAAIGVSVAEIGQFEDGLTRVGAARLTRLAEALEIHISAFFDYDRAALFAGTANPS